MNTKLMTILAGGTLMLGLTLPVAAHHSFSAEFDNKKPVTLVGEVEKMDWVNPHSWLYLTVKKDDGTVEHWAVEGGSPGVLLRLGWTRDSLPKGTKITVTGFQSKDGALRANSRSIEFPDGRKLDTGSSYTGGKDGKDKDGK